VQRFLDNSVFRLFGRWTQFLFLIASFIAVIVTLVSFSGFGPIRPASRAMIGLLAVNFALIGALAFYVARDFFALSSRAMSEKEVSQKSRLGRRFALLFSFAAVAPAIFVALFLGTSLNRGIENWFSERIQTIVQGSADIARSNLQALAEDMGNDIKPMARDLNAAAIGYETQPEEFERYLFDQASVRGFSGAFLVDSQGNILVSTDESMNASVTPPTEEMYQDADGGIVSVKLLNETAQFWALFHLPDFEDAYVYTVRPIDPRLLESLMRFDEMNTEYRQAEERSRRLQIIFLLGFTQITVLILLFFIRFGLQAASQISTPIAKLANAADDVRKGVLTVSVPMPKLENEVSDLTASFNAMTEKLREQRSALDAAHKEALERSTFIEAVLEGVTAGIIRVDHNLNIVLSNPSARRMFPMLEPSDGAINLAEAVPEFASLAQEVLDDQELRERSMMLEHDGKQQHILLRVAPTLEDDPGCILTFDDTTRIVSAQRQSAWRDVARRIAHEIRNPLTPIQLSTERLRRRYRKLIDEDDTVFDRCTDTIFRQVTDIGRMVEEFSSFARMPKPEVKSFDMAEIVKTAVYGGRLTLPDVRISLHCQPDVIMISGDERLLGQALTNLIKNAGEAIARHEEQTDPKRVMKIDVNVRQEDQEVLIEIEDTGPGFPMDNRSQFLEPYFTTREQGVGLGLAIVQRIVQDHGGQLTLLDRHDGQSGARVAVKLPVSGPSEETVSSWGLSEERV
tara:strand:- start:11387 stop:13609 length:2223 start_codon:yes stop_codon:yes gene_type:complete